MAVSGSEFALAIVRFVADDSQLVAAQTKLRTQAQTTAREVGDVFSSAGLAATKERKMQEEYMAGLGFGLNSTSKSAKAAADAHGLFNLGLNKTTKGLKQTLGPLLHLSPALTAVASKASVLIRTFGFLPTQLTLGLVAFQIINQVIVSFIDVAKEAIDEQVQLNKSYESFDPSYVIQGITTLTDLISKESVELAMWNKKWEGLDDVWNALVAGSMYMLGKSIEKQAEQATKLGIAWDKVVLPKMLIDSAIAGIDLMKTHLDGLMAVYTDTSSLEAFAAKQAELANANTSLLRQKAQNDAGAEEAKLQKLLDLQKKYLDQEKENERVAQLSGLKEYIDASQKKVAAATKGVEIAENNITALHQDTARKMERIDIAAVEAQIKAQESLAAAITKSEKQRIDTASQAATLTKAADERIAADAGVLYQGLEVFEKQRRDSILATAALDEQEAIKVRDVRLKALQDIYDAAHARGDTVAESAAAQEAELVWAGYEAKRTQMSADTANKLKADANAVAQEQRAQLNAIVALEDQLATYRRGLGQQTIAEDLALQQQRVYNYALTAQQRQNAEVNVQQIISKLGQDTFDLARAQGKRTETDAVNIAGSIASKWKEGTQQRLDAEKKFAGEVKALWDKLVSAGRALEDMAISALAAEGNMAPTLADIARKTDELTVSATRLNAARQAGAGISTEELTLIRAVGDANKTAKEQGVTMQQQLSAAAKDATMNLSSEQKTTDGMVGSLNAVGVAVGNAASNYDKMVVNQIAASRSAVLVAEGMDKQVASSKDVQDALRSSITAQMAADKAWEEVAASEQRVGDAALAIAPATAKADDKLAQVVSNFKGAYGEIEGATDKFYETLGNKIQAGNSRIADTVYQYFTNEVIRKLDAEASRS